MIKAIYSIVDDHYTYLSVKGHAQSGEYGKDLVCAGVSSIMFGLMNSVDQIKDVEIKELKNHIEIINNSKKKKVDDYFEVVLFQLKTLEESCGKFIKVERK